MRTLRVTGDDFGASVEVNAGIVEGYDRGILTGASLMVTGPAFEQAVRLAIERPALEVGLHLVLADGRSALPHRRIPDLVDANGRFPSSPLLAGLRYQFHRGARRQLREEIRAQLERFAGTGLRFAHVDGHHHLHLHPFVLAVLLDEAPRFAIGRIRLPSEELSLGLALDPRRRPGKLMTSAVFALLHRNGRRRLAASRISFSPRVYGLLATGRITESYLARLIPRIHADEAEIYCHPAARGGGPSLPAALAGRSAELAALRSPRVRAAVEMSGFVLGTGTRAGRPEGREIHA